jgi:hypothetical protein
MVVSQYERRVMTDKSLKQLQTMPDIRIHFSPEKRDGKYVCKCCGFAHEDIESFGTGQKCWDCSLGTSEDCENCEVLRAQFEEFKAAQRQTEIPRAQLPVVDVIRDGVRLYKCMCSQFPHTGCGCRLTDPSSYWAEDGTRRFYIDEENNE